jgi:hypothetical protein
MLLAPESAQAVVLAYETGGVLPHDAELVGRRRQRTEIRRAGHRPPAVVKPFPRFVKRLELTEQRFLPKGRLSPGTSAPSCSYL